MRDLFTSWASVYPLAFDASVAYWAELVANASNYHADVVEHLGSAVCDVRHADAIFADLATCFKGYLERSGDLAERTVLEFNDRLMTSLRRAPDAASGAGAGGSEALDGVLRGVANLGMQSVWKLQESGAVDLRRITEELQRLLGELGRLQERSSRPSQ